MGPRFRCPESVDHSSGYVFKSFFVNLMYQEYSESLSGWRDEDARERRDDRNARVPACPRACRSEQMARQQSEYLNQTASSCRETVTERVCGTLKSACARPDCERAHIHAQSVRADGRQFIPSLLRSVLSPLTLYRSFRDVERLF